MSCLENWKTVKGTDNLYEISDQGRVRNRKGFILKSTLDKDGYVRLTLFVNSKRKKIYVHSAVLIAFDSDRPSIHHQCRHKDGNCKNNTIDNLEWGLPIDNIADKKRHGTHLTTDRKPNIKLNHKMVDNINKLLSMGLTQVEISRKFDVSASLVSKVKNRNISVEFGGMGVKSYYKHKDLFTEPKV